MKMFERNDLIFRAIGIFLIYQEELFIKTNWSDPVVPHSLGQTVKEEMRCSKGFGEASDELAQLHSLGVARRRKSNRRDRRDVYKTCRAFLIIK
ncbi:hypothetical protein OUZ56_027822 [Daphnia magna]|uniref:Uncharacterized protein n=1 Tax=Daphnia magna TaxID=35525 RepID=A0ABR0B211_9CRUS|nr:hypothetical protein OUZ56_027822 [Daphnia magna]